MDPLIPADDHDGADSLAVALASGLCALGGLCLAAVSIAADGMIWLVAGVALGALGPVLITLVARRIPAGATRGRDQAGWP